MVAAASPVPSLFIKPFEHKAPASRSDCPRSPSHPHNFILSLIPEFLSSQLCPHCARKCEIDLNNEEVLLPRPLFQPHFRPNCAYCTHGLRRWWQLTGKSEPRTVAVGRSLSVIGLLPVRVPLLLPSPPLCLSVTGSPFSPFVPERRGEERRGGNGREDVAIAVAAAVAAAAAALQASAHRPKGISSYYRSLIRIKYEIRIPNIWTGLCARH